MSDVLLASSVEVPAMMPARWSGLRLAPLAGPVVGDKELALVWENYDFGARAGSAEFDVSINIRRERSAAGRITARIVGGVLGREVMSDRVELTYDRSVPHAATIVEHITIGLGDGHVPAFAGRDGSGDRPHGLTHYPHRGAVGCARVSSASSAEQWLRCWRARVRLPLRLPTSPRTGVATPELGRARSVLTPCPARHTLSRWRCWLSSIAPFEHVPATQPSGIAARWSRGLLPRVPSSARVSRPLSTPDCGKRPIFPSSRRRS
jgi:hypothetical protein